jgi:hypothetical protein
MNFAFVGVEVSRFIVAGIEIVVPHGGSPVWHGPDGPTAENRGEPRGQSIRLAARVATPATVPWT